MKRRLFALAVAAGMTVTAAAAGAAIINGDFEDAPNPSEATNTFTGWTEFANPANGQLATIHPGLGANGGNNAAKVIGLAGGAFVPVDFSAGSNWAIEFDLAVFDPDSAGGRVFQLFLPHTGGRINLDVNASNGNVQVYDQSETKFQVALAGAVDLSTADNIRVNHVKIVGDYSDSTPSYTVSVTDADGVTRDSASLAYWQNSAATEGSGLTEARFEASGFTNTQKYFVVDNVAVPEPAAAAMGAGLAGGLLLRRSRVGQ